MSKIKLLVVSDSIEIPTGVGGQAKKLLYGLQKTGDYEIVEIAGSLMKIDPPVYFHSVEIDKHNYGAIKLYNTPDGYGNVGLFRQVFNIEKPDIVLAFSDPRFFTYLFMIDNEFRNKAKFVFYHTWDNDPFPSFNRKWYAACDAVVMISKFSYNLMKSGGIDCYYIPHGFDAKEFHKLPEARIRQVQKELFKNIINVDNLQREPFTILWSNRNIGRKRPGDIIRIFKLFNDMHEDSVLLLNTAPVEPEGTNLLDVIQYYAANKVLPIAMIPNRISIEKLNELYNAADVTVNISSNEGFGLCVGESLMTETPVIVTKTGGMTEQAMNEKTQFGRVIEPAVRELIGTPSVPYIFRDFVSDNDVLDALEDAYIHPLSWKSAAAQGRVHISENYSIKRTVQQWDSLLKQVQGSSSKFERIKFREI